MTASCDCCPSFFSLPFSLTLFFLFFSLRNKRGELNFKYSGDYFLYPFVRIEQGLFLPLRYIRKIPLNGSPYRLFTITILNAFHDR